MSSRGEGRGQGLHASIHGWTQLARLAPVASSATAVQPQGCALPLGPVANSSLLPFSMSALLCRESSLFHPLGLRADPAQRQRDRHPLQTQPPP